jgi:TetR/AcrR family transcriptional regulator, lmrAB and yxaGH operons repressor
MSAGDRIIEAATDLFQRRGFHAVGVSDILARAAAPKGSLYHHFPGGKDELGAKSVARIAADVSRFIEARATGGDTGALIVGALADLCATRMLREDFAWSPLISGAAGQAGPDTPLLAAALKAAYASWLVGLERAFAAEDLDSAQAASAARLAIMTLEGAVALARAERDVAALKLVQPLVAQFVAGRLG